MVDSEPGVELLGDPVLAPFGMLTRNASDKGGVLSGDPGPDGDR
jgi:hypothetical protein